MIHPQENLLRASMNREDVCVEGSEEEPFFRGGIGGPACCVDPYGVPLKKVQQ